MPHTTPATNSILQASLLESVAFIIGHHVFDHGFQPVTDFQDAYRANRTLELGLNTTTSLNATIPEWSENATSIESGIKGNTTAATSYKDGWSDRSLFLFDELPKTVVAIVFVTFLRYYWLIWLERLLPARPRPRATSHARTPSAIDEKEDDSREEEVIRKWIEAGKVTRASLSWFNTFAKWILDLTIWNLFYCALDMVVIEPLGKWRSPMKNFSRWELLARWAAGLFGYPPLATLVAFILVPAPKRVVFEAGVSVAWSVFFAAFVRVIVPWAMEREFVLDILRNATETDLKMENKTALPARFEGGDEL